MLGRRLRRAPQDLGESALSGRAEGAGLRGVAREVVDDRRVVVGHVLAVTEADALVVAAAGARWREVGREVVNLEDGVAWTHTHTHTHTEATPPQLALHDRFRSDIIIY